MLKLTRFLHLATTVTSLLLRQAAAFSFELNHHPLVSQRIDLIVKPHSLAGHDHNFAGGAAMVLGQDPDKMCTTADIKADKSLYWAPGLYHYNDHTKLFTSQQLVNYRTLYIDGRIDKTKPLREYPKGLFMIGGNSTRYEVSKDKTKDRAKSFTCHNWARGAPQTTATLPDGPCPQGLTTRIVMPSCWNGHQLDSEDHHAHVIYPLGGSPTGGHCPSSHPVQLLSLIYELTYATGNNKRDHGGKTGFALSTGDMEGHSMHGDFVNRWTPGVLQHAIDKCPDLSGTPHDLGVCDAFKATVQPEGIIPGGPSLHHNDVSDSVSSMVRRHHNHSKGGNHPGFCTTKQSVKEKVLGSLKTMPGCRIVQNGKSKGAGGPCAEHNPKAISEQGGPDDGHYFYKPGSLQQRAFDEDEATLGGYGAAAGLA